MICESDVNGAVHIKRIIHLTPETQNPQILRPVGTPAIPVSRFRAGKVLRFIDGVRKSTA